MAPRVLRSMKGKIFYPFKRLPPEIRQTIWRLTLQPRVVEVLWKEKEADAAGNDAFQTIVGNEGSRVNTGASNTGGSHTGIRFFSYTALPVALGACPDSRDAVLSFYPLCFASNTQEAAVRFNFSIDTLFLDVGINPYLTQFLDRLSQYELSKLRSLYLSEYVGFKYGYSYPNHGWTGDTDREIWRSFWKSTLR